MLAAKGKIPEAITEDIQSLINIAMGDYTNIRNSLKNWLKISLESAANENYEKFKTKLSGIGWSIDQLVNAYYDHIQPVVDPQNKAEIALLKAYVRSETRFIKDENPLSADQNITLYTGDTLGLKLSILGYAWAGDVLNWTARDPENPDQESNILAIDNKNKKLTANATGRALLIAYNKNPDTDWAYKGTVVVSTRPSAGVGAPSPPPPAEKIEDIQQKLESGEISPEEAAKNVGEYLAGLAPEKAAEVKEQVKSAINTIVSKAGAVAPEQVTTTDTSATVTVSSTAIASALANLESVHKTLTEALAKAKLTDVAVPKQLVLTVPPEAAAKPEVVVEIPAQSLTDISNAGAELVVRPSDAVAVIFPALKAQSAALQNLVAGAGSFWLKELLSAANPTVQVKTRTLNDLEAARLVAALPSSYTERMTLAGKIVEIDITTAGGRYTKPVRLQLSYDPAKAKDAELLGAYTYDEAVGAWKYAGGKVDPANKAVDVQWSGLDQYAVMEYDRTFADAVTHWARREIKVMAARHLVAGISKENFAPDRQITRAEFAVILARMMNLAADPAGAERFRDIPADAWYRGMVGAAAKAGLVAGMSQDAFAPEELITREQMAAIIARLLMKQKGTTITDNEASQVLASFQDAPAVSPWAKTSVALVAKESIMIGREAAVFAPGGKSTRAEATVVLYRALQKI